MSLRVRMGLVVFCAWVVLGWALRLAQPAPSMPRLLTLELAPVPVLAIVAALLLLRGGRR